MWFFSFYSLVTSCFACHLYISCKSCTCLSLCKLGHLLSSCLGHWFCMLFKLGSCISKRVRLFGEKESILITISSLPDARLRDSLYICTLIFVHCSPPVYMFNVPPLLCTPVHPVSLSLSLVCCCALLCYIFPASPPLLHSKKKTIIKDVPLPCLT